MKVWKIICTDPTVALRIGKWQFFGAMGMFVNTVV